MRAGLQPFVARSQAVRMVLMLGVVSLLSDITYEGARSVAGPFLGLLGASGAVIAMVSGIGELLGYGLRLFSGRLAERSGRPWAVMLVGYAVNLLAVPALALLGAWPSAAALMVAERVGKGMRTPARDAMLSHAASRLGHGWGFGLHEAMDQLGAIAGPLIVAAVLARAGGYRGAFLALLVPALAALTTLALAHRYYPHPEELEVSAGALRGVALPRAFWWLVGGACCLAAGFADFPFLAYQLGRQSGLSPVAVPLLYAGAMGVDALAALALGRLWDRFGWPVLIGAVAVSAAAVPLVLLAGRAGMWAGMAAWAVGLGTQESVLRAAVATLVPAGRRSSAFGLFNGLFGFAWFAGSSALGLLSLVSLPAVAALSLGLELAALPFLLVLARAGSQQGMPA